MNEQLSDQLSPTEQARLTAGAAMWETGAVPALGLAAIRMADGPMGIASGRVDERDVSLLTPCPTALGASWDVELVGRVGALVGGDAARRGVDAVLAPNVNLARSPLAGRAFEYFSEDPLLAGVAGAAWVSGVQSTGVAAVAKHLVCNDSETDRHSMNAVVDERTLREVYLLPFELAAAAGAGGMLTAYNRLNGTWCAEQTHVIVDIVKTEWRFPGVVMSDWFGTHSTAPTLVGGLDLEMPGPARFLGARAVDAVEAGEVTPARLAHAAERVMRFAERFGGGKTPPAEDAEALLAEAAAAGFVLLRNAGGLLPLAPAAGATIAVIGPNAAAPCYQGGTFAKIAVAPDAATPLDAIRARFSASTILFEPGVDPQPRLPTMPVAPARDLGDGSAVGMTLDYFDNDRFEGSPRSSETRATNSLVWFAGVHGEGVWDQPAGIRASGRFTPAQDGEHLFYLGGTGAVSMRVDGREILRRDDPVPASDVMGRLKSGEADSIGVALVAGRPVLVEVEFAYAPARVQGLWYGIRAPGTPAELLARAVAAARAADTVILVVGETSDSSVESKDRADTRLSEAQLALIEAVTAANPRTAIVANVGHAFDASWGERAAALLVAWYPGQAFGTALAEVLSGDHEPGGRLPVTLARREQDYPAFALTPAANGDLAYDDGVAVGYRGLAARGTPPLYAFGSGIGYARLVIEEVALEGAALMATVRNLADRPGSEVVQVYRRDPAFALVGFAKVIVPAGESRRVMVLLEPRLLRTWGEAGWVPIERTRLAVGRASDDLPFELVLDHPLATAASARELRPD